MALDLRISLTDSFGHLESCVVSFPSAQDNVERWIILPEKAFQVFFQLRFHPVDRLENRDAGQGSFGSRSRHLLRGKRSPSPPDRSAQDHEKKNRGSAKTQHRDGEQHIPHRGCRGHAVSSRFAKTGRLDVSSGLMRDSAANYTRGITAAGKGEAQTETASARAGISASRTSRILRANVLNENGC